MKKLIIPAALFAGFLLLNACKKDVATKADITIEEPAIGDTVAFGDSVHMEGYITGDGELHGYTVTLMDTATGTSYASYASDNHETSYVFHEHWPNAVTDTVTLRMKVEVEIDHDGNKASKSVNVVCLPQ